MNIFKSIYPQKNRLYIDWDLFYVCNYRCSYCFQNIRGLLDNANKYNKFNQKNISIILKFLKKLEKSFTLGLLGGEPTLFPDFNNLLNNINETLKLNNSECYVSTNLSRDLNFWKKLSNFKKDNIHLWISFHPEYQENIKTIIDKLDIIKDKFNKIILSPMLYKLDNKHIEIYKIFTYFQNQNLNNIFEYHPQFIFNEKFNNIKYKIEKLDKYTNNSVSEFFIDNINYTLNELLYYKKKNLNFNNYKCEANYFYIDPLNNISNDCRNYYKNLNLNFINVLKDLNRINQINCTKKLCIDYPLLLSTKTKE